MIRLFSFFVLGALSISLFAKEIVTVIGPKLDESYCELLQQPGRSKFSLINCDNMSNKKSIEKEIGKPLTIKLSNDKMMSCKIIDFEQIIGVVENKKLSHWGVFCDKTK